MESYPHLFRKVNTPIPERNPNPHQNLDVPLIDLALLDPNQLGRACRDFGLFKLINHGTPSSLSAQLHLEAMKILSLPFESKKEAAFLNKIDYFWGTPTLSLSVRNINWLEGLHVPLAQIQPKEDLDWCSPLRSSAHIYGQHMARIARTVFNALAIDLGLDRDISASYLSDSDGMLRIYRYPCCPNTSSYLGMEAHTDSSVMSIVNQDDVGGLQVLHNDQWFNIAPVSDTLLVNIGDMMQAMSNDEYRSVKHRVAASMSRERVSMCYFAFPLEDGLIVSSRYQEFTYKEFRAQVEEDIKTNGFKVGLQRFKAKNPS